MVPRASTRSRCSSGDVVTTTTASTRFSPPVSNSKRNVDHDDRGAGAFGILEEFLPAGAEHGMNDLLELLHRRGIVHHALAELLPIHPCRSTVVPGKAASIAGAAAPS